MDIFERINKNFANWYESWFGDATGEMRPKDILRKIITTMEDNRKEGIDNRVYVPNKYILEIAFENDTEREYLLALLDKEELERAIRRYMAQNKYHVRGPIDFTIQEAEPSAGERLRVKCKWDVHLVETGESKGARVAVDEPSETWEEELTIPAGDAYELRTVTPPSFTINHIDGSRERFLIDKPVIQIGRSRRLNNDLVLDRDGMVSKRHARITIGAQGFTITDLNSTNGVWVNGEKVTTRVLQHGDRVRLGATEMVFEAAAHETHAPAQCPKVADRPKLVIKRLDGTDDFLLASEVLIGKSPTSDVRISGSAVEAHHARVFSPDGIAFYIETVAEGCEIIINGESVGFGIPVRLMPGDVIKIGDTEMCFERS